MQGNILMNHDSMPGVTIVIPTYQEVLNLPALAQAISQVDFKGRPFEVLLMDDQSQDGSLQVATQLAATYPWLKMIVRQGKKSLSDAIIEGIQKASYPLIVTMDADLSHPPEKIPEMLALLTDSQADMVIGSRYVPGGSTGEQWPLLRLWISRGAALLARKYLSVDATDPLSGFIAIKKSTVQNGAPLKPIGWKVGLEIMIKCGCREIREIPIHFAHRCHGNSKLNLGISLKYLLHVQALKRFMSS